MLIPRFGPMTTNFGFRGPASCFLHKLAAVNVGRKILVLARHPDRKREDRLRAIEMHANFRPNMVLVAAFAALEEETGDEYPAPAEDFPTDWDGKNRQTVAIIVIDVGKKKLAYKQRTLPIPGCLNRPMKARISCMDAPMSSSECRQEKRVLQAGYTPIDTIEKMVSDSRPEHGIPVLCSNSIHRAGDTLD